MTLAIAEKTPFDELVAKILDVEEMGRKIDAELPKAHDKLIQAQEEELTSALESGALEDFQPGQGASRCLAHYNDLLSKGEAAKRMRAALCTKLLVAMKMRQRERDKQFAKEAEATRQEELCLREDFAAAMARAAFIAIQIWGREDVLRRQTALYVEDEYKDSFRAQLDCLKTEAGISAFADPPSKRLLRIEIERREAATEIVQGDVEAVIEDARKARGQ